MMRVLGVDGGQSGIRLKTSIDDRVVEMAGVSRLEGDTIADVATAIGEAWRVGGRDPVNRAVLGLTTAPTDAVARERLCVLVSAVIDTPEIWLADDAVTAHVGALSMGWGVSVVAGTGVASLVVPVSGEPLIVGGHGYLLGDEGGGFWIGREGLRAVLRAADGRGPQTGLSEVAAARFDGLADLGDRLHSAQRPVNDIAQFAPEVLAMAEAGDPIASDIVDGAADELLTLVRAGEQAAGADEARVPVALGGRLLASSSPLRVRLERRVRVGMPGVVVRSADGSALDGALALGCGTNPGRYQALVHVWHRAMAA